MSDTSRTSPIFFRLAALCLLGFALLNGVIVWHVRGLISEGYGDFASFYTAGKIVSLGESVRLYDPSLQWQVQQQFAKNVKTRVGPLPYIRPPFEALLFLLLSYLSYPAACWVWLILKAAILLAIPFLLPAYGSSEYPGTQTLKVLLCFAFFPVGFDMLQGQDSILLLLILVMVLRLLVKRADLQSGAVLALGLFKFHIVIPIFLIIALKRRGRSIVGFVGTGLVLFLISLFMVHWSGVLRYPQYLWTLNQIPGLGMVKPESMPNVRGMLTVLLGNGTLPAIAQWFLVAVVIAGIAIAAKAWRDDERDSILYGFAFAIVAVLVTSYYANSYDLTLLLLPLLLLAEPVLISESRDWPRTTFLLAAAVLAFTPLLWAWVIKMNQFCWLALVLAAFGVSIFASRPTLAQQHRGQHG
jgi:Glycosyltransferase family 87